MESEPLLRRAAWFLAAVVAGLATVQAARAEDYCNDCLAKALQQNADQTYNFIKGAWTQYSAASALLKKAEASGSPADIEKVRAVWRRTADVWARAEKLAKANSSPGFAAYLGEERARLAARTQQEQARLKRETELYKRLVNSTFGPQRDAVVRDILSYKKEADDLKRTMKADALTFGLHSVEYGGSEILGARVEAIRARLGEEAARASANLSLGLTQAGKAQFDATMAGVLLVREGRALQHAVDHNQSLQAYADGMKLAGEGALRFAKLVGESPQGRTLVAEWGQAAAAKGPVALAVVALALDTGMVCAALRRLEAADRRIEQLEVNEKTWRARIATAGAGLSRARERLALHEKEIESQQKIAALYGEILASRAQ